MFQNRSRAGRDLAELLLDRALPSPVVLALPRGGVPVGHEVAQALQAPMDVLVVRKVGAPKQPEYGIGAIAESGVSVMDDHRIHSLGIEPRQLKDLIEAERVELDRRVQHYRGSRPLPDLTGRSVVIVDDGLATGVTAEAAVQAVHRRHRPASVVLAVPVCAPDAADRLRRSCEVVCVEAPESFGAVGRFYADFRQTSDAEVLALLDLAAGQQGSDA